MRRRRTTRGVLLLLVLAVVGGNVAFWTVNVFDRLTRVAPDCGGGYPAQTPASYGAPAGATPQLMPGYEAVTFASRDPGITIAAWWVPGSAPDAPAVVLAHGLHECKRATTVLFPAGLLHAHGFSVLLIDLRNEGSSTVTNGRFAGGVGEARDILGAWDWLRHAQGIAAGRIGLFGVSLGAGASLIAAGQEPAVAAVWSDSSFADLTEVLRHQIWGAEWPPFIVDLAFTYGRLQGIELTSPSPAEMMARMGSRPVAIVHGERDGSVPVAQAERLISLDRAAGGQPVVWLVADAGHTQAMYDHPAEYERRLTDFFAAALGT